MRYKINGVVDGGGIIEFMRSSESLSEIEILNRKAELKEVKNSFIEDREDFSMVIIESFEAEFDEYSVQMKNIHEMTVDFKNNITTDEANQKVNEIAEMVYENTTEISRLE